MWKIFQFDPVTRNITTCLLIISIFKSTSRHYIFSKSEPKINQHPKNAFWWPIGTCKGVGGKNNGCIFRTGKFSIYSASQGHQKEYILLTSKNAKNRCEHVFENRMFNPDKSSKILPFCTKSDWQLPLYIYIQTYNHTVYRKLQGVGFCRQENASRRTMQIADNDVNEPV